MMASTAYKRLARSRQVTLAKHLTQRATRIARLIALRAAATALAAFALVGFNPQALAATDSWAGTTSVNWADSNWGPSGNNPPQTGDSLQFGAAGTQGATLTDNLMTPANYTINGITFDPGAPAFVINSGTAGVNGFTLAGNISNLGGTLETINDGIVLSAVETVALTAGGGNITLGGPVSGIGGITLSGTTTGSDILTLSGDDSYTGATTVPDGSMIITGTLGSSSVYSGAITVGTRGVNTGAAGQTNLFEVNGGAVYAASLTIQNGNGSSAGDTVAVLLTGGGSITLSGNLAANSPNLDSPGLVTITSGTFTANSATVSRTNTNAGATIATAPVNDTVGIYVNGGTLNLMTTLGVGVGTNSSAFFRMDSGFVNVTGIATVGDEAGSRYSFLNVNGGTFTDSDTTGVGMQIGGVTDTTGAEDAELLVTSGTLNTPAITLGGTAQTSGNSVFVADGGITYIGSGGIVSGGGGGASVIQLSATNVATTPIIAASGTWSSALPMTLLPSSAGGFVTFQTANATASPEAITLSGGLSGAGGFNVTGGGTLTLSGADTFTGAINIPATNTLAVTGAGSLGGGTYAGNIADSGTFSYSSSVNQTLSGVVTVGGALIENGPGPLRLAGADTVTGSLAINGGILAISPGGKLNGGTYSGNIPDAGTFSYGGSTNQTLSGVVSGTGGVTEAGAGGRLILTAPETYTGPTAITSGTLILASTGSLSDTAITASQGATFLAQPGGGNLQIGSTNASLSLNAGATFSMADGTIGTVTLTSGTGTALTLNGTTSLPATLTFDLGHSGGDELLIPNGSISFGTSPTPLDDIAFVPLTGVAPTNPINIPLLSIPNGVLTLSDFGLSANTVTFAGSVYNATLSLGGPGSDTELLVSLSLAGSANYYFTGNGSTASWGTIGNFATDHTGGTAQSQLPHNTSNIFLTADLASNYQTETIDGNFQVNSLNFTGTDTSVGSTPAAATGIALNSGTATAPLDILATSAIQDTNGNLYAAGTGLVVQAGSAAHTIDANIDLGNSQAWEIDNSPSNPLTMNGVIADGSTLDSLNKTGNGTLILTNMNTYDGGTIVSGGTLMMAATGLIPSAGPLTVQETGTFDLAGTTQTVSGLFDGGVATGVITSSGAGSATLIINNTTPSSYSGVITDSNATTGGSLALYLEGSSNVTLSGSSNFTGGTDLNSGTLTVANDYALGNPTTLNPNAGLTFTSGAGTVNFTSPNPNIATLAATQGGNVVLGNPAGSGTATTLYIGGGGLAQTGTDIFEGVISDQSGTAAGAVGNLVVYGGGFLTLVGANTFTGTVTVTGTGAFGASELNINSADGLENATLNINDPEGEILFGASPSTVGGVIGNSALYLNIGGSGGSTPLALVVGNNGVSSNFAGTAEGGGSIEMDGAGTFTLSGTQTLAGGLTSLLGTLSLTGAYGSNSAPAGTITVGSSGAGSGTAILTINGATVYTPTFTEDSGPGSGNGIVSNVYIGQNASGANVNIAGNLAVDAGNGDEDSLFEIESGTVSALTATIGRGNANLGPTPGTQGVTSDGIYVNGGNLVIQTTLSVGSTQASTANFRMDNGSVTVGGVTTVTDESNARFTDININGGTFTEQDTSGVGIQIGGTTDPNALDAELVMEGGTLITPEITMGGIAQTSGIDEFLATGGLVEIGSGGIINGNPTGTTVTVAFGSGILATAPTIEATGSWSSSLNISLTNGAGNLAPTFVTSSGSNITLSGALSGGGGLIAAGTGILSLTGANSYSGATAINGGILNAGSGSALGDTASISFGGGTLEYSGSNTTDYSAVIINSTAPISINTNGEAVTFATSLAASNTGGLSLTDSAGTGSLTLTQAANYTGPTSIGPGANLILTGSTSLGNSAISVATGGTFAPNPGSGGNIQLGLTGATLTLAAGATLILGDGSIGTVTLNSPGAGAGAVLTLGGTTASPDNLIFDIGGTGADELIVNGGTISFAGGAADNIVINSLGGAAPGSLTDIPLLSEPNGSGLTLSDFSRQTNSISIGGAVYDLTLSVGGTGNDELFLNLSQVGSANYYFTGLNSGSWQTITNFAPNSTGTTTQGGTLGSLDNIFLTSNNATNYTSETLDGNYTINSLSFTGTNAVVGNTPAATAGITLSSGAATAPLVIAAGNSFGDANGNSYATGIGLVDQAGSAAHTITANINLGSSQIWEIDSSSPLTMTGVIADGTTLDSLTKTGTGTLILANANTYDGGTIVQAGTLMLGATNAILPTSALTVSGTGTLDLAGVSQSIVSLADGGSSNGVITTSTGSSTLTINNITAIHYKGGITDNNAVNGAMLSLMLSGTSTVRLSGTNSYSGLTTLNGGTLVAASNSALGSGTSASGGLLINPVLTGTATVQFTSNNPTISALANSGTGVAIVILGNSTSNTPTTLDVTGVDSSLGGGAFGGSISDLSSTSPNAVGNLTVSGGTLTLDGSDTFTGATIVSNGGTLVLGNTAALQDSTLLYNNQGGTLGFGALTAATLGGLSGAQNLSLTNGASNAVALTIGANNSSPAAYSGGLGGLGSLIKSGSGSATLSGLDTYAGSTTVSAGVLTFTNALGTSSTPTGALLVTTGTLAFNGASVYAPSLSQNGGGNVTVTGASSINVGTLAVNSNNANTPGVVTLTNGTVVANAVTIGRDNQNAGTGIITTGASTTDGLYVDGGTLNVATTISVGFGATNNNSTAIMRMDAGVVNVTGPTYVSDLNNTRTSLLDINGGVFTDTDTSGVGIDAGGGPGTAADDGTGELLLRGAGVINTPAITLGSALETGTGGSGALNGFVATGGTAYIGAGGIVSAIPAGSPATYAIDLGASTVATFPTLAASASWTSSLNMTLTTGSNNAYPTFQAASASGSAANITLSGTLSGSGGLETSGAGIVTLSGSDSYTGATTVSAGRLIISGSVAGTASVTVNSGANLEVDGLLTSTAAAAVSGRLSGIGTVNGATVLGTGTLAAGFSSGSTTVGTLTSSSNVIFSSNTGTLSIRLGLTTGDSSNPSTGLGGDVDQLSITNGSALTLDDTTLRLNLGAAEASASIGSLYVIVNGGAGVTGSGTDVFGNAPLSGDSIVAGADTFDVFYATDAANDGAPGNDIDVELVGVPEPGAWAEIIAGLSILCIWQRSRRRDRDAQSKA